MSIYYICSRDYYGDRYGASRVAKGAENRNFPVSPPAPARRIWRWGPWPRVRRVVASTRRKRSVQRQDRDCGEIFAGLLEPRTRELLSIDRDQHRCWSQLVSLRRIDRSICFCAHPGVVACARPTLRAALAAVAATQIILQPLSVATR